MTVTNSVACLWKGKRNMFHTFKKIGFFGMVFASPLDQSYRNK
jgi:hypothetical protein